MCVVLIAAGHPRGGCHLLKPHLLTRLGCHELWLALAPVLSVSVGCHSMVQNAAPPKSPTLSSQSQRSLSESSLGIQARQNNKDASSTAAGTVKPLVPPGPPPSENSNPPVVDKVLGNFTELCGEFPPAPDYVGPGEVSFPASSKVPTVGGPVIAVGFNTWTRKPKRPQGSAGSSSSAEAFDWGDFYAILRIDAVKLSQKVFHSTTADLHQCCVGMIDGQVTFSCRFSGAADIINRGAVSILGDKLTARWCTALEHGNETLDKGERVFRVNPKAHLRLSAPQAFCSPDLP